MSGVYIKNMEMQNGAYDCPFANEFWECTLREDLPLCAKERMGIGCPLIPVPDHGRLIDADAYYKESEIYGWQSAFFNAPTIIPADLEWQMKNCCCKWPYNEQFGKSEQLEEGGE